MGDAFLLVGGYINDSLLGITDAIYKYEHGSWTELETKLPFRMENLMATMVDLDIFPSCSGEEATTQEATTLEATTLEATTQEATTQEETTQEATTIASAATSLYGNASLALCFITVWLYKTK